MSWRDGSRIALRQAQRLEEHRYVTRDAGAGICHTGTNGPEMDDTGKDAEQMPSGFRVAWSQAEPQRISREHHWMAARKIPSTE